MIAPGPGIILTSAMALLSTSSGEAPGPRDPAGARAGAIALDRERLERAAKSLADAWFVIERDGRSLGYHRVQVRRGPEGGFSIADEMVIAPRSGKLSLRSEVSTGADLTDPLKASCETLQGPEDSPALRGTARFGKETIELSAEIFVDGLGQRFPSPHRREATQKRPAGPILFQSLVPLLLAALPDSEDGSGLGELVLVELPADVDRLLALKPERTLEISPLPDGGRRIGIRSGKERATAATLRFTGKGEISRIEMESASERRAEGEEEVRRAVPWAFKGK